MATLSIAHKRSKPCAKGVNEGRWVYSAKEVCNGTKKIIRIGDQTSHGGTVLEGHEHFRVLGKPVAGVGHRVSCPQCVGEQKIVEGSSSLTMMGVHVAVEGMKTSCGATLVGSAPAQDAVA